MGALSHCVWSLFDLYPDEQLSTKHPLLFWYVATLAIPQPVCNTSDDLSLCCWLHHPISTYFRSSFCLQLACTPMCRIPENNPQLLCTTMRWAHRTLITGTPRRDRSRNIQVRLLAKARTDTFLLKRRPWNGLFVLGLTSC